jgi:cysteine desulfurase/selenocysteine lyase
MFDIQKVRSQFPALDQLVHGKQLVYLDNSATTLKPQVVIDSIVEYYSTINSNIHRGIHYLSQRSTERYEEAREVVARFINAPSSREVIFTKGVTESINLVAHSYGETFLNEGDEIITTAMEHHSNLVPWQALADRKHLTLKFVPFNHDGELDMDMFRSMVSEKTRMVSVTWVSNSLGTVNNVKEIIELAHAAGAHVVIDGAQAVQHMATDVQQLGCDFFAFSGHKVYGPTGIGVLWGKEDLLEKMVPYQYGGDMIETVRLEKTTFNRLPFKFEAGTSNYVDAWALAVALNYLSNTGIEAVANHEHMLMEYATSQLKTIDNLVIYGNARHKAGAISFLFKGVHPADVGMILDKQGIAVRTGTHCTEPVMQYYGIPGTARASFAMYNTKEEIDVLVTMLKRVGQMFA